MTWCLVALLWTLNLQTPNLSLFPEIDVAAKVVVSESHLYRGFETYSISKLLSSLSNAGSREIWKALSPHTLYVRYSRMWNRQGYDSPPVVITVEKGDGFELSNRSGNRQSVRWSV